MRYAYARLSRWDFGAFRLFGPGLGNLLFPWVRSVIYARRRGIPVIWPTWPQLKLGPILRRERDKRMYGNLFACPEDYVRGTEKLRVLTTARKVSEADGRGGVDGPKARYGSRGEVIEFRGMEGLFRPLRGAGDLVLAELLRMTREEHKKSMAHDFSSSITIHVRMGDFAPPVDSKLRQGSHNVRVPLEWYIDTICAIRSAAGSAWPVWIFSDGADKELMPLLRVPHTNRLGFGSAISDMLAMSKSTVLLPSSTFSMWAAYLGGVPTIWYPGQKRELYPAGAESLGSEREYGQPLAARLPDRLAPLEDSG